VLVAGKSLSEPRISQDFACRRRESTPRHMQADSVALYEIVYRD